jgi:hypothetical protein
VLLPGSVVQLCPHTGAVVLSSNPLKLLGALPPLSELSFDHWAPQNVTVVPFAALLFPIAKVPPAGVALTITVNEPCELFPAASVALHDTVVVPIATRLPDGGLHVTLGLGS